MGEDGSRGQTRTQVVYQRFVRNAVEAVAPNSGLEIASRKREVRRNRRDGLMKSIVEAGVLRCCRKNRLCGSYKRKRLRDVQRGKMRCRAQFSDDLRRDDLMLHQPGAAVHHAMADRGRCIVGMLSDCRNERAEGIALRFVDAASLQQFFSVSRSDT